jgi:hypothetical protein
MRIVIETLPADEMRYRTDGDWFTTPDGVIMIQINEEMPQHDQFLIAIHELIEMKLCESAGVTQQAVDDFDMAFTGDGEPGDAPGAPYIRQHRFAALIDHMIAHEMGIDRYGTVDWEEPK